jgi:SAM-dependent methyltransferase
MSDEWDVRNESLASRLSELVAEYAPADRPLRALDIGTQHGTLPTLMAKNVRGITFRGIEPGLPNAHAEINGIQVERASCDALPFTDASFEVVTLASVFEHIVPDRRIRSLSEIHRVLVPGGVLVGQIPNMNFPIELHSRLPLPQFLPRGAGEGYVRALSPVPWRVEGVTWYRVGPAALRQVAKVTGFRERRLEPCNPPREALPKRFQRLHPLLDLVPLGYAFAFSA